MNKEGDDLDQRSLALEEISKREAEIIPDVARLCEAMYSVFLSQLQEAPSVTHNVYAQMETGERNQLIQSIQSLFGKHNNLILFFTIYNSFATKHNLLIPNEGGFEISKPKEQLSDEELYLYLQYLKSIELITARKSLIAKALHIFPFPVITTRYRHQNEAAHAELKRIKNEIITTLLPNTTDEEAKILLGNPNSTLKDLFD